MVEHVDCTSPAWRQSGLGGSDAAAVLGLSPWRTPVDVYLEKIGESEPQPDSDAMFWGRVLEDPVAAVVSEQFGLKHRRRGPVRDKRHAFLTASVDRLVVGRDGGFGIHEIKTARDSSDWGDAGKVLGLGSGPFGFEVVAPDEMPEVPAYYLPQPQHYLSVYPRASWALVSVFFLLERRLASYLVQRDEVYQEALRGELVRFWSDHVVPRVPPPPTSGEDVAKLFPRDDGSVIAAGPEEAEAHAELLRVRDELKALEERKSELESSLKAALCGASRLVLPDGKELASWKTQASVRLDQKRLKEIRPEVFEAFQARSEYRVFRLKKG